MKSVTVMSGPAIRKLKSENARLREQNRRLRRVLELAASHSPNDPLLERALIAAREIVG